MTQAATGNRDNGRTTTPAEHQIANCRMQAVGADDHVEVTRRCVPEPDGDAVRLIVDVRDGVGVDRFDVVLDCSVDRRREIATGQAGKALVGRPPHRVDSEGGPGPAVGADRADLLNLVAQLSDIRVDPHLLGDGVAQSPEVDDIAAGAELRCLLDQRHLVARTTHPVGESRSSDTRPADSNFTLSSSRIGPIGVGPDVGPVNRGVCYSYFVRNARCA